ncbi:MAG TPA: MerR family transcriptional regulator [Alphaproteobacteria bacterium]|nr:MerR family transcriptional regulator [Alphaproteobacteria bacterium]
MYTTILKESRSFRLGIAAVARETGFSKELLRIWERRYGFPKPERDRNGDRLYRDEDLAKLRSIRRLLDRGMRPSRLAPLSRAQLVELMAKVPARRPAGPAQCANLMALIKDCEVVELRRSFKQAVMALGLQRFVFEIACPLAEAVGSAWEQGVLDVFQEHLFSEALQWVLREAAASVTQVGGRPVVALATPPGERHGLGLLMVETILVLNLALCIPLGVDLPVSNLARIGDRVDVVALSISAAYPADDAAGVLRDIRRALPQKTEVWAGGAGTRRVKRRLEAITVINELEEIGPTLRSWREAQGA